MQRRAGGARLPAHRIRRRVVLPQALRPRSGAGGNQRGRTRRRGSDPARAPHSSEIRNTDVLRMVIGGAALALLGVRRYVFARPPLLGPSGRVVASGVTIFTGYPFLRGALRSLRSGRAGTDALVSAATVASLILRENVVALTVLWLLNIGEYLAGSDAAAHPAGHLGVAARQPGHGLGSPDRRSRRRHRNPGADRYLADRRRSGGARPRRDPGRRRSGRRRGHRQPIRDHRREPARQRRRRVTCARRLGRGARTPGGARRSRRQPDHHRPHHRQSRRGAT